MPNYSAPTLITTCQAPTSSKSGPWRPSTRKTAGRPCSNFALSSTRPLRHSPAAGATGPDVEGGTDQQRPLPHPADARPLAGQADAAAVVGDASPAARDMGPEGNSRRRQHDRARAARAATVGGGERRTVEMAAQSAVPAVRPGAGVSRSGADLGRNGRGAHGDGVRGQCRAGFPGERAAQEARTPRAGSRPCWYTPAIPSRVPRSPAFAVVGRGAFPRPRRSAAHREDRRVPGPARRQRRPCVARRRGTADQGSDARRRSSCGGRAAADGPSAPGRPGAASSPTGRTRSGDLPVSPCPPWDKGLRVAT